MTMEPHSDTAAIGLASAPANPGKLAEQVARMLEDRIVAMGWPVGKAIGFEPDLLAEFKISRAVFREAVRLLEHHSVATMRRGSTGGLVVTAPHTSAIVQAAARHLRIHDASPRDLFESRSAIELRVLELAAAQIDESGIARLHEVLAEEASTQETHMLGRHDLHLVIADLSGNPVLRLFLEVLTKLSVTPPSPQVDELRERGRQARHAHARIVQAIADGDVALARHRMQRHLIAIGRHLENAPPAVDGTDATSA